MVFKRPTGSRDDRPGKSTGRSSRGDEKPKRPATAKGKATPDGEKKKLSRPDKPFQSNRFSDDKPKSNFRDSASSGDKKSSGRSKPYSGRPSAGDDRPKSNFRDGASSGDKKTFSPRSKPYSGRPTGGDFEDRPKRSFGAGSSASGERKPYSGRPTSGEGEERPKRNFGGSSAGEKKPYSSPLTRTSNTDFGDKPKRSFGTGAERSTDKKFGERPEGGFKKREGGFSKDKPAYNADKPQRKPTYDKITKDTSAPERTMRGRKKPAETKTKDDGLIRLNRYISNAGICSRRKADELIIAGVVSVNGVVVDELGAKIDPRKDEIKYNGETLRREKMVYVLLNKPKDYITTTEDPQERRTVMHLVEKATKERIYPIGRLDRNTTGLLLMTNDGDLADKLSHPRSNISKLYQVELNKALSQGDLNKITYGIELEDGLIKPDSVSYVAGASKREVGIQIHSGKNRVVRRIFESLGYEVVKLDRVVYANLTKKDLPRGRYRHLEESEIIQLKHLIK
ncbi:pseudouridine synthase [Mucilaginibacter ginsenosidivorax]|uniref:Pseudouridine synthase n=1 Tax=Mucilaginibacter ginsenosidivorax TaxID=862126 RepID=A0A5B8W2K3_9SPHI|nr:pseudouridine synthase [Mucilaginibacter ginsenosidivorax]QEC77172.1 pseudouridine synthase [Mucilaginibacter ginsenosidivorax]